MLHDARVVADEERFDYLYRWRGVTAATYDTKRIYAYPCVSVESAPPSTWSPFFTRDLAIPERWYIVLREFGQVWKAYI
jgi:hypothetical protein